MKLKSGKEVRIQLYDTAGQERFRTIAKAYYKGAHGIILMYDVTNQKSYDNIKRWLEQIKKEASNKICILLVANKVDMKEERVISIENGKTLATENNLKIIEASAKEDINVSNVFQEITEEVASKFGDITKSTIKIENNNKENVNTEKGCCK